MILEFILSFVVFLFVFILTIKLINKYTSRKLSKMEYTEVDPKNASNKVQPDKENSLPKISKEDIMSKLNKN